MTETWLMYLGLILVILFIVPVILLLRLQQQLLQQISPENRTLTPGKVWLQLIPIFGMIYQFKVFRGIADAIARQLAVEDETDWLAGGAMHTNDRPTYTLGLTCGILWCCSIVQIPIIQQVISLATIICWVMYWIKLHHYYKVIKARSLMARS